MFQVSLFFLQLTYARINFLRSFRGKCDFLCFLLCLKVDDPTPFDIQAEMTLKTNFFATRNVCTELLPIVKPHGKSGEWIVRWISQEGRRTGPLGKAAPKSHPGLLFLLGGNNRNSPYFLNVWLFP
jgi:hypothetical protein